MQDWKIILRELRRLRKEINPCEGSDVTPAIMDQLVLACPRCTIFTGTRFVHSLNSRIFSRMNRIESIDNNFESFSPSATTILRNTHEIDGFIFSGHG